MRHGQVKQYTHGYKRAVGVLFFFNSHGDADLTHITEQNICFHVRIHNTGNIVTDTRPLCYIAERIENRVLV